MPDLEKIVGIRNNGNWIIVESGERFHRDWIKGEPVKGKYLHTNDCTVHDHYMTDNELFLRKMIFLQVDREREKGATSKSLLNDVEQALEVTNPDIVTFSAFGVLIGNEIQLTHLAFCGDWLLMKEPELDTVKVKWDLIKEKYFERSKIAAVAGGYYLGEGDHPSTISPSIDSMD